MRLTSRIFLNHWRAKLGSLLLATVLWLVIKHGIAYSPILTSPVAPPASVSPQNALPLPRA